MIPYDFGYWGVLFVFKRSSVFLRAGCIGLSAGVSTFTLCWYVHNNARLEEKLPDATSLGAATTLWGGWTFVITFLLVFRTNIAYGRYMEGVGLLQQIFGVWLNAASDLCAFSSLDGSEEPERVYKTMKFRHLMVRLMSLMYCTALQEIADMEDENFEVLNAMDLDKESLIHFAKSPDRLEIILQWVQHLVCENHRTGIVWTNSPIVTRVFQELSQGVVMAHDAMKINEYPFPFPYAQMLTVMLLAYTMSIPFAFSFAINAPLTAGLLAFAIIFSQWSMTYIAAEIELPFGDDPNDLEMRTMSEMFNRKLVALMHPLTSKTPDFNYDPSKHRHDNLVPAMLCIVSRRMAQTEVGNVEMCGDQIAIHGSSQEENTCSQKDEHRSCEKTCTEEDNDFISRISVWSKHSFHDGSTETPRSPISTVAKARSNLDSQAKIESEPMPEYGLVEAFTDRDTERGLLHKTSSLREFPYTSMAPNDFNSDTMEVSEMPKEESDRQTALEMAGSINASAPAEQLVLLSPARPAPAQETLSVALPSNCTGNRL